ncbi:MAG: metal ABC transporter ATP-binding protein [Patescibacteria group bacterium]
MAVLSSNNTILHVENLFKKYGEHRVLHDVTFDLAEGSIVGVIGPNGAGKSTLVNIVLGFDTNYGGTVVVKEGTRIAYVPQHTAPDVYALPLSVYEFLRTAASAYYGSAKSAHKEQILHTLRHVGLDKEHLQQNVHSLSGGQRQRALIARALLSDPTFLVLDEPLSSVDFAARDSLYTLLKHLNQEHNITMLLVSHDVESIVAICDSVLCLNETLHHGCHPAEFALRGMPHHHGVEHGQHT